MSVSSFVKIPFIALVGFADPAPGMNIVHESNLFSVPLLFSFALVRVGLLRQVGSRCYRVIELHTSPPPPPAPPGVLKTRGGKASFSTTVTPTPTLTLTLTLPMAGIECTPTICCTGEFERASQAFGDRDLTSTSGEDVLAGLPSRARFLRWYSLFLAGERRREVCAWFSFFLLGFCFERFALVIPEYVIFFF